MEKTEFVRYNEDIIRRGKDRFNLSHKKLYRKENVQMENVLEFRNISKYFPGVKALDNICFKAKSGEVLAFMGENGAGKSTLLKVLNGDYQQDAGEYLLNGEPVHFRTPNEAIEAGISVIYQERQVLPELSVAENIYLGRMPANKLGVIKTKEANEEAKKSLKISACPLSPLQRLRI